MGFCAKRSLRSSASQKQMFRPFGSSEVRADFGDFYQKNMRGGHMPPSSESLKHRFSKFWKKSVKVTTSMVNGQCFEQNLNDFLELFSKKVQTSYSGRLRAPAVHGVSSYGFEISATAAKFGTKSSSANHWKSANVRICGFCKGSNIKTHVTLRIVLEQF